MPEDKKVMTGLGGGVEILTRLSPLMLDGYQVSVVIPLLRLSYMLLFVPRNWSDNKTTTHPGLKTIRAQSTEITLYIEC